MSIAITGANWVGQQISGVLEGGPSMPMEVKPAVRGVFSYHVVQYTIATGDTLTRIARRFSVSVDQLTRDNEISNPHLIKSGAKLYVVR